MDVDQLTRIIANSLHTLLGNLITPENDDGPSSDNVLRSTSERTLNKPKTNILSSRRMKGNYRETISSIAASRMEIDNSPIVNALDLATKPMARGSEDLSPSCSSTSLASPSHKKSLPNFSKSSYAAAIAALNASKSSMDCLEPSESLECDSAPVQSRTVSAYAKAAQILAASSGLRGEDRETVLTLLMDFDRSMDYCTDDDAMSSLYD
jgi:hypothetical protein